MINSTTIPAPFPYRENQRASRNGRTTVWFLIKERSSFLTLFLTPFLCPPFFPAQRLLLVINTVVCISRMHLALTPTLKKAISGRVWLLSSPVDAHRWFNKWAPGSIGAGSWGFPLPPLSSLRTPMERNGLVMSPSKWLNVSLMDPQMQNLLPQPNSIMFHLGLESGECQGLFLQDKLTLESTNFKGFD